MCTSYQSAKKEGKEGIGAQDRAAPAGGLPWTKRAKSCVGILGCLPEREAVILWLSDPAFPAPIDVHQVVVVKDFCRALQTALQQGYTLAVEPVTALGGTCAVIQGSSGHRLCLLEKLQAPHRAQRGCSHRSLTGSQRERGE